MAKTLVSRLTRFSTRALFCLFLVTNGTRAAGNDSFKICGDKFVSLSRRHGPLKASQPFKVELDLTRIKRGIEKVRRSFGEIVPDLQRQANEVLASSASDSAKVEKLTALHLALENYQAHLITMAIEYPELSPRIRHAVNRWTAWGVTLGAIGGVVANDIWGFKPLGDPTPFFVYVATFSGAMGGVVGVTFGTSRIRHLMSPKERAFDDAIFQVWKEISAAGAALGDLDRKLKAFD